MVEYNEEFKKKFPHLAREVEESQGMRIDGVRQSPREGERAADEFQGFNPGPVDFLRRCSTDEQGMEIISFLEKRGEIEPDHALELRAQLLKQGIRSFGPKKKRWAHYK